MKREYARRLDRVERNLRLLEAGLGRLDVGSRALAQAARSVYAIPSEGRCVATIRVQDSLGAPIAGAEVTVDGRTRTTDSNGRASFSGLSAGTYAVTVEHPAYGTHEGDHALDCGSVTTIALQEAVAVACCPNPIPRDMWFHARNIFAPGTPMTAPIAVAWDGANHWWVGEGPIAVSGYPGPPGFGGACPPGAPSPVTSTWRHIIQCVGSNWQWSHQTKRCGGSLDFVVTGSYNLTAGPFAGTKNCAGPVIAAFGTTAYFSTSSTPPP